MGGGPETAKTYASEGVYLLRTAQQIQYQLSQMADQKASMLLGATFVIFTITVSQIQNVAQPAPLLILGAAAFVSAFLAVIAVLPSTKAPPRADGPANVLFFGSFTQVPEAEYVEMLLDVVSDSRTVYEAFAHDIYQNGRVLARKKYRFLAYAYRILLGGLVMSFLTFIVGYFGLLG
jgi:hypothetical protein